MCVSVYVLSKRSFSSNIESAILAPLCLVNSLAEQK